MVLSLALGSFFMCTYWSVLISRFGCGDTLCSPIPQLSMYEVLPPELCLALRRPWPPRSPDIISSSQGDQQALPGFPLPASQPRNFPHAIVGLTLLISPFPGFTLLCCLMSNVWKPLFYIFHLEDFLCVCGAGGGAGSSGSVHPVPIILC